MINIKKRKFEMGRQPAMTKLGPKRIYLVRCRGGNIKHRAIGQSLRRIEVLPPAAPHLQPAAAPEGTEEYPDPEAGRAERHCQPFGGGHDSAG